MKRNLTGGFVYATLIALALPLAPLLLWSFAQAWPWPDLLPRVFGTRAWEVLGDFDAGFLQGLGVSCLIASIVTLIALIISLPLARVLGGAAFPGKSVLEVLVLLPLLLPAFVVAMGLHETLIASGWTDTYFGVILLHLVPTTPYMVRTLSTGFSLMGTRLEDQARTLGARSLRILWSVTLPRLLPAIVAGSTFVFLASLGEYLLTMLIGGNTVQTLPLVLYPLIAAGDRPLAAVGSLLLCLAPLVAMICLEAWVGRRSSGRIVAKI